MTTHQQATHESLSALLDGECNELEMRRLLKQLDADPALRDQFDQLSRSRAALQADTAAWAGCDVSLRVRDAVAAEPFSKGLVNKLWQPLAQTAVAASVAVAVVIGVAYVPLWQDGASQGVPADGGNAAHYAAVPSDGSMATGAMTRNVSTGAVAVPVAPASVTHTARAAVDDLDRFEPYVQRHAEYASYNSNSGLMPFARVASFQRAE